MTYTLLLIAYNAISLIGLGIVIIVITHYFLFKRVKEKAPPTFNVPASQKLQEITHTISKIKEQLTMLDCELNKHFNLETDPDKLTCISTINTINQQALSLIDGIEPNSSTNMAQIDCTELNNSNVETITNSCSSIRVLVVDDDDDIRNLLIHELSVEYKIYDARNGKDAWEIAFNELPDIIISDLKMPIMDGLELCDMVKNNPATNHIAFIMLTAQDSSEIRLKGLNQGADSFICKPFKLDELKVRISNILKMREQQKAIFMRQFNMDHSLTVNETNDKEFINNVMEIIYKHLSNENFGPDEFAKELTISRALLYKKIQAISGQSVSIFIRNIRLKRAHELLKSEKLSVAEIAYLVGFSDPSYFSKCFKKLYNVSPTRVRE